MTVEALADPTRRRLVELLASGDHPAGKLAEHFDISQPAISRHLRVLREAGIVSSHVDAQRRIYRLEPSAFEDIEQWLRTVRATWNRHLDALEAHLDRQASEHEETTP